MGLEKIRRIFKTKSEIASCKKQGKSENIFKSTTIPVLVSLLIEVVGLNVDQIGLTSFDPDSDQVMFEAKSALVYSVTIFIYQTADILYVQLHWKVKFKADF